jgi:hypothetical protein
VGCDRVVVVVVVEGGVVIAALGRIVVLVKAARGAVELGVDPHKIFGQVVAELYSARGRGDHELEDLLLLLRICDARAEELYKVGRPPEAPWGASLSPFGADVRRAAHRRAAKRASK